MVRVGYRFVHRLEGKRLVSFFQSINGVFLRAADVLEKADDLRGLQLARMALLMKEDKPLGPLGIPFAWLWAAEVVACVQA